MSGANPGYPTGVFSPDRRVDPRRAEKRLAEGLTCQMGFERLQALVAYRSCLTTLHEIHKGCCPRISRSFEPLFVSNPRSTLSRTPGFSRIPGFFSNPSGRPLELVPAAFSYGLLSASSVLGTTRINSRQSDPRVATSISRQAAPICGRSTSKRTVLAAIQNAPGWQRAASARPSPATTRSRKRADAVAKEG
jgi:hypothetical protein